MRFIFLFLLLLFAIGFINQPSACQTPPDSCLKIFDMPGDTTFHNPCSVLIDSCLGSPTYGRFFSKQFFRLSFQYNIIPRNYIAPADTIIEYTTSDILPNYTVAIAEFKRLQDLFGSFWFREEKPEYEDTTLCRSRVLLLRFENNIDIKEVVDTINTFSCIKDHSSFINWWAISTGIYINKKITEIVINNPVHDFIELTGENQNNIDKIFIYTFNGDLVKNEPFNRIINVAEMAKGVYFLKVGNQFIKFVKL